MGAWAAALLAVAIAAGTDEPAAARAEDGELAAFPAEDEGEAVAADAAPAARLPPAPGGPRLSDGGRVLLDRVERPDGTALERILESSGEVVLHEVNRVGTVLSCRTVGALGALRVVQQRDLAGGEVVRVVRDASGALLRFVVGPDGEPRAVALLAPPPR